MKFVYLLVICVLGFAATATAQKTANTSNNKKFQLPPPDNKKNLPTVTGSGGGSRKKGFDVNFDARQKIWESQNKRHSIDASGGYSQHLGGPYGNSRPDVRVGAGYTYRFGKG